MAASEWQQTLGGVTELRPRTDLFNGLELIILKIRGKYLFSAFAAYAAVVQK